MPETDIYRAYNFVLDLGNGESGYFTEVSGLSVFVEAIEARGGGDGPVARQLAGRVSYGPVLLKWGLTNSTELWNWLMTAVNGKVERKNVSIVLKSNDGQTETTRWNLTNAWLKEWRGAHLNALGQEVAIETLTLVHEGIERK
jgi:phage tail-like protein